MEQFEWAARNIDRISRRTCYEWAMKNFSLEAIAPRYEEFFDMLLKVRDGSGGFYAKNPERKNLDWMVRHYPDVMTKPENPIILDDEKKEKEEKKA
jgi:hypothetical protein